MVASAETETVPGVMGICRGSDQFTILAIAPSQPVPSLVAVATANGSAKAAVDTPIIWPFKALPWNVVRDNAVGLAVIEGGGPALQTVKVTGIWMGKASMNWAMVIVP